MLAKHELIDRVHEPSAADKLHEGHNAWRGMVAFGPPVPPSGFDIKLSVLTSGAEQIWGLVEGGALDGYVENGERWVRTMELEHYFPKYVYKPDRWWEDE